MNTHEQALKAAQELLDVIDAYPEQLVPINSQSASVRALRKALADLPKSEASTKQAESKDAMPLDYVKAAVDDMMKFMLQERFETRNWHPAAGQTQDGSDLAFALDCLSEAVAIIRNLAAIAASAQSAGGKEGV